MNKFVTLLLVAVTLPACYVEPGARVHYRNDRGVVVEPEIVISPGPAPSSRTTTTRQRETVTYTGCHANDYDYSYSIADCWDGSYEFERCSTTYIRPYCLTASEIRWEFQGCTITDVCENW